MAWIILIAAGLLEVVWAYYLKQSHGFTRLVPSLVTLVTASGSFFLLAVFLLTSLFGEQFTSVDENHFVAHAERKRSSGIDNFSQIAILQSAEIELRPLRIEQFRFIVCDFSRDFEFFFACYDNYRHIFILCPEQGCARKDVCRCL